MLIRAAGTTTLTFFGLFLPIWRLLNWPSNFTQVLALHLLQTRQLTQLFCTGGDHTLTLGTVNRLYGVMNMTFPVQTSVGKFLKHQLSQNGAVNSKTGLKTHPHVNVSSQAAFAFVCILLRGVNAYCRTG